MSQQRPKCPDHPAERLQPGRIHGWTCESCEKVRVPFEEWPGPCERLAAGLPVSRLPTFLASKIHDVDAEEHPIVRLWMACDTVETLLRLLTALGVADMEAGHGALPDAVAREFLSPNGIERPTMDAWLRLATMVGQHVTQPSLVPEPRGAVDDVLTPLLRAPPWGIARLRNDLAHGGVIDRMAASEVVGQYVRHLRHSLARLPWLEDLLFTVRIDGEDVPLVGPDPALRVPSGTTRDTAFKVHVTRSGVRRSVWPICACIPSEDDLSVVPSLFVRAGDNCLEHFPIRHAFKAERLREPALQRFRALFRVDEKDRLLGRLVGFTEETNEEAAPTPRPLRKP